MSVPISPSPPRPHGVHTFVLYIPTALLAAPSRSLHPTSTVPSCRLPPGPDLSQGNLAPPPSQPRARTATRKLLWSWEPATYPHSAQRPLRLNPLAK